MRNFKKLNKHYSTANSIEKMKPFLSEMLGEKEVKEYFHNRIKDNEEWGGAELFILFTNITNSGSLAYVGTSDELLELINGMVFDEMESNNEDYQDQEKYEEYEESYLCNLHELKNNI